MCICTVYMHIHVCVAVQFMYNRICYRILYVYSRVRGSVLFVMHVLFCVVVQEQPIATMNLEGELA